MNLFKPGEELKLLNRLARERAKTRLLADGGILMDVTKLFINKGTSEEEEYIRLIDGEFTPLNDTDENTTEVSPKNITKKYMYRAISHTEERLSPEEQLKKNWKLKDVLYIPVGNKEEPFIVEHVTDEKIYFVSKNVVGMSPMSENASGTSAMNAFLDNYMAKIPNELAEKMQPIEHGFGFEKETRKLSLLSLANINICFYKHTGKDDIPFDGLRTEADRCKNYYGETQSYWVRFPCDAYETEFWYITKDGKFRFSEAYSPLGAVVCFTIRNNKNKLSS